MQLLIVLLAVVLIGVVALVISAPLRVARRKSERSSPERAELEAAREAKYREIRDAELDYRTGKLSRADFEAVDGALRAEGLEILDRLQVAERVEPAGRSRAEEHESLGEPDDGEPRGSRRDDAEPRR